MNSEKVNILIIEDHLGFAQGLELLLTQHSLVSNTAICTNYSGALDYLRNHVVHIVILDLNFETDKYDGFIIAKKLKQLYPNIKIMVLTQHARKIHHKRLFTECGVNAYLDKKLGIKETYRAIDQVAQGNKYIDENIEKILEIEEWMTLSEREKEVMKFLCQGLTQKEIAQKMFIVPKTVEAHLKNMFTRFNAKNSAELIAKYLNYKNANRDNVSSITPPFKKL